MPFYSHKYVLSRSDEVKSGLFVFSVSCEICLQEQIRKTSIRDLIDCPGTIDQYIRALYDDLSELLDESGCAAALLYDINPAKP